MAALAVQDQPPLDPAARIAAFMQGFSVEATSASDGRVASKLGIGAEGVLALAGGASR